MNHSRFYCWLALFGAILLEVAGTTVMKLAHSWSFPYASLAGLIIMWLAIGLSYYLLALATLKLPVGVAYAFWEALGLSLVCLASVFILKESLTWPRVLGLACLICGALLVNFGTSHGKTDKGKRN